MRRKADSVVNVTVWFKNHTNIFLNKNTERSKIAVQVTASAKKVIKNRTNSKKVIRSFSNLFEFFPGKLAKKIVPFGKHSIKMNWYCAWKTWNELLLFNPVTLNIQQRVLKWIKKNMGGYLKTSLRPAYPPLSLLCLVN